MSLPVADIRAAVHTALSASCTYPVHDIPPSGLTEYVVISAIRLAEDTGQSWMVYDCYVTIDIVTKYQKVGNRADNDVQAVLVDAALRPSVTGGITVTGWDRAGCWLDSEDEYLSNDPDGKTHRVTMSYYMKFCKQ